jgi:hypothetical protein
MTDKDMPNRASNMEKAEGERRDQDGPGSDAHLEDVVNRSGAGRRTPRRYDEDPEPADKP